MVSGNWAMNNFCLPADSSKQLRRLQNNCHEHSLKDVETFISLITRQSFYANEINDHPPLYAIGSLSGGHLTTYIPNIALLKFPFCLPLKFARLAAFFIRRKQI